MPIDQNQESVILYDSNGVEMAVSNGVAVPAGQRGLVLVGSDGVNLRFLQTDAAGVLQVAGAAGGTASNYGSAFPATGTAAGYQDAAAKMQGARVYDVDPNAADEFVLGVNLRKANAGGSIEIGTVVNPIRVDPTGTTTQPVSLAASGREATYDLEVSQAGAANLIHLSLLNPAASGKVVRVYAMWAIVETSSGASVIIRFEFRRATAFTAGGNQDANIRSRDTTNPAAVTVARSAPTAATDAVPSLSRSQVMQINSYTAPMSQMMDFLYGGNVAIQPETLRPGEGLYAKQITAQASTFRVGATFSESAT